MNKRWYIYLEGQTDPFDGPFRTLKEAEAAAEETRSAWGDCEIRDGESAVRADAAEGPCESE